MEKTVLSDQQVIEVLGGLGESQTPDLIFHVAERLGDPDPDGRTLEVVRHLRDLARAGLISYRRGLGSDPLPSRDGFEYVSQRNTTYWKLSPQGWCRLRTARNGRDSSRPARSA